MSNPPELIKKKSSLALPTVRINIFLTLINNITNSKDDKESCICSYEPAEKTNYENELIPDVEFVIGNDDCLKLNDVIIKLKQLGYPLTGAMITLYSEDVGEYINCGADPVDKNIQIDENKITQSILKLKCTTYIEEKFLSHSYISNTNLVSFSRTNSKAQPEKKRRTKERKIGYIIEKVNAWRRLYNGYYNFEGEFKKKSLDEAAKIIKISKKSLDDYLLQLRLGRKYGFDFNKNKDSKVGVLRSFVKDHRNLKSGIKTDTSGEF